MPPAGTNGTGGTNGTPGTGTPGAVAPKSGPKSFASFFDRSKLRTEKGLIVVHFQDDKYYFEIPNALMNKDFLTVTRYVRMTPGAGVYGGEQANENVLRFEKGPENKVFLRTVLNVVASPDSTKPIYQAVRNSNVDPIVAAFDIKAFNRDTTGVVIDVTDFFKGDNQVVSLSANTKRQFGLASIASDRSYIETIRSFNDNTEIRTSKTFTSVPSSGGFGQPAAGPASLPAARTAGVVTIETNTSFIRLPDVPMKRRAFDPRVGFFADQISEFADTAQRASTETFIARWRLEPKPEDVEKYKRGELVEPKKPIIYYIDPATPDKWKPYLIAGINDWQVAFEKAGFKNAIIGKEWPKDSTMSLEAANYSAIRYLASDISNAYGPNVHDPRSGEIFESHIGWYHNVMKLLQNWYFIQAAAVDPGARKMVFDDQLMGDLVRFVSSHEVGHTLGLRHNMGSSSFTPVEKLRDKEWVEKNGHTVSIMDYARFNYVAQPGDNISRKGLYPRIGEYDMWAIEWGYRWTDKSEEEDRKESNKLIIDRLSKNPKLWFGGEGRGNDPRAQTEDLSDNAMKASDYGVKNLKYVVKNLPEWTKEEGDRFENLSEMYGAVLSQFNRYANHVARNIGGVEQTYKSIEQAGDVYAPTPKAKQREAVNWLQGQVFTTPSWLLDKNILNKIAEPVNNNVNTLQTNVLSSVLSASRLARMIEASERFGSTNYSALELIADLKAGIFSELRTGSATDMYRRNLQKAYVERVIALLPTDAAATPSASPVPVINTKNTDVPSIARGHLTELLAEVRSAINRTNDKVSKYHLMDIAQRIDQTLNPK
ncbi:glutaminyl-tRNA synthetase [Flavisolibacter tropicus]|uniref:Glutaminyl-tRNA synthetase n=2 Tax=Flavisolibacter tropicus TaxID=1492898 RepID=A0A172U2R1_9BACT|nr:glutaminyl-tRNA synthetase [Flavisolibacter tropicus]